MQLNPVAVWVLSLAVPPAVLLLVLFLLRVAANRFAQRQRRLGRWDASGPLHPSEPPAEWHRFFGASSPESPRIEHDDDEGA